MSSVSRATSACLAALSAPSVRMLCSRSDSLIMSTRGSFAIATSILRSVAACWACLEAKRTRSSLVTPSTMAATSGPKSSASPTSSTLVSSTASCSSAAAIDVSSRPRSATTPATATGWVMYASPVLRRCPSCASRAAS